MNIIQNTIDEDDDFMIPYDGKNYDISSKIMENVSHLWRESNLDKINIVIDCKKNIEEINYIVLPTTFDIRENEKTISLFELNKNYQNDDLQVESFLFLTFLQSEAKSISKKTIPVSLIKETLLENINSPELIEIFSNSIKKTEKNKNEEENKKENYILSEHWDINPPFENDKKMHAMQNILAKSSKAYFNMYNNKFLDQNNKEINVKNILKKGLKKRRINNDSKTK